MQRNDRERERVCLREREIERKTESECMRSSSEQKLEGDFLSD